MQRYKIMAETSDGKTIECFTWVGRAYVGVVQARRESREDGFSLDLVRFWSVEA